MPAVGEIQVIAGVQVQAVTGTLCVVCFPCPVGFLEDPPFFEHVLRTDPDYEAALEKNQIPMVEHLRVVYFVILGDRDVQKLEHCQSLGEVRLRHPIEVYAVADYQA